ncbi:MAG: type II secretion system protein GspG [Kiritimatiellae bacterium]|nr:type II secretion system protein GspG [Kiritimatiellia bacterium]
MEENLKNAKEAAKAGFTLVELLVVVAILGILGAVATMGMTGHTAKAKVTATRTTMGTIDAALESYATTHKLPKTQEEFVDALTKRPNDDEPALIKGGKDALNDAWGNPIQYTRKGKHVYLLRSAGEDEEFNTDDDILNDQE